MNPCFSSIFEAFQCVPGTLLFKFTTGNSKGRIVSAKAPTIELTSEIV